jgi:hypothetical protein
MIRFLPHESALTRKAKTLPIGRVSCAPLAKASPSQLHFFPESQITANSWAAVANHLLENCRMRSCRCSSTHCAC